jgi:lipoprotein-anchoring transpeptidase ErfK/SrfK
MSTRPSGNGFLVFLWALLVVQLSVVILMQLNLLVPLLQYAMRLGGATPEETQVAVEHLGPIGTPTKAVTATTTKTVPLEQAPLETNLSHYVEIVDSCNDKYAGTCVRARALPSATSSVMAKLRAGMVLKVAGEATSSDGSLWYKIGFDEWLRYPERITGDWYVAAAVVKDVYIVPHEETAESFATGTKKIVVDRSEQQLYAYDGDTLFLQATTSTGLLLTPTPRGIFHIFKKVPTRYMQGPLPYLEDQEVYDLPGVPWSMYFTSLGAAIHGAYWHHDFGNPHSHGCVNLPPDVAEKLYRWAVVGTTVLVQD